MNTTTPTEMARELHVSPGYVRAGLRAVCPRSPAQKYQRWILGPREVEKFIRWFNRNG